MKKEYKAPYTKVAKIENEPILAFSDPTKVDEKTTKIDENGNLSGDAKMNNFSIWQ